MHRLLYKEWFNIFADVRTDYLALKFPIKTEDEIIEMYREYFKTNPTVRIAVMGTERFNTSRVIIIRVINATINNISVKSWLSVLLVEETKVLEETPLTNFII
jgi:hypothetical protein